MSKDQIAKEEARFRQKINNVEIQVACIKGEFKEDISNLILQNQLNHGIKPEDINRWMIGMMMILLVSIMTLFIKENRFNFSWQWIGSGIQMSKRVPIETYGLLYRSDRPL